VRLALTFVGFTILLGWLFPLQTDLYFFLPTDMFSYPRKNMTKAEYEAISLTLRWIIPAIVVGAFVWRARLRERLPRNLGTTLLFTGTLLYLAQFALKGAAAFVPGGGALFVAGGLLAYVMFPIKVLLFAGAVYVLMSLKPLVAQQAVPADVARPAGARRG